MTEVKACDPPALAVEVDGQHLQLMSPSMPGVLSRVDLIAWETRPVGDGRQVQLVAVTGVPSMAPSMPLVTRNEAVSQQAIAWVEVRAPGYRVEQKDIHPFGSGRAADLGAPDCAAGLAEWLLEQVAEDERVAGANSIDLWPGETLRKVAENKTHYAWQPHDVSPQRIAHILRFGPRRVLAECDAKRKVINLSAWHLEAWRHQAASPDSVQFIDVEARGRHSELTLKLLALPYADRPGYRESWRP